MGITSSKQVADALACMPAGPRFLAVAHGLHHNYR